MISKQFHYQLRNSEKQAFVGPPDNMREHVLAAAKGKFYFHPLLSIFGKPVNLFLL